jgi:transposase
MSGYVKGVSRDQATLFPERLDELIGEGSAVRVVDAFVGGLKLGKFGFTRAAPAEIGRPGYDPKDLLKLYVYGYLNQVRSSRQLERECGRNIEVLWLLSRLKPDFKTIADFRRDNRAAIGEVCRWFVQFCRHQGLFAAELVAIDGSKFAAQSSPQRAWTKDQLEREAAKLDKRIAEYLAQLDTADAAAPEAAAEAPAGEAAPGTTRAALDVLRTRRGDILQALVLMGALGLSQVTLGDGDARLMRSARGASMVGYNVQVAVDSQHGLIVHHAVTQDCSDQNQLAAVAQGAKAALGVAQLEAVADAGYADAEQLQQAEDGGIMPFVAQPRAAKSKFFAKAQFVYDAASDTYRCPADGTLRFYSASAKNQAISYVGVNCAGCALKPQCTNAPARWVTRHLYEDALARLTARMKTRPGIMVRRGALAEHPFGIIKAMMGFPRFLCRGLRAVAGEMALSVTAFNLKRVIAILGARELIRRLALA